MENKICSNLTKSSIWTSFESLNRRILVILRKTILVRSIKCFWSGSLTENSNNESRGIMVATDKLILNSLSVRTSTRSRHRIRKCIRTVPSLDNFFTFLRTGRVFLIFLNARAALSPRASWILIRSLSVIVSSSSMPSLNSSSQSSSSSSSSTYDFSFFSTAFSFSSLMSLSTSSSVEKLRLCFGTNSMY